MPSQSDSQASNCPLNRANSNHRLDGFADVGTLVGGDIFFVKVKSAVPVVDEYLPEAVAAVIGLWVEKHDRRGSLRTPSSRGWEAGHQRFGARIEPGVCTQMLSDGERKAVTKRRQ